MSHESSPENALPAQPGIDLNIGLARLNNRRERYLGILKNFHDNHLGTADAIQTAHRNGEREVVNRTAHTIKSVADYMGASTLQQASLALETITRDPTADCTTELAQFVDALGTLMALLETLMPSDTN